MAHASPDPKKLLVFFQIGVAELTLDRLRNKTGTRMTHAELAQKLQQEYGLGPDALCVVEDAHTTAENALHYWDPLPETTWTTVAKAYETYENGSKLFVFPDPRFRSRQFAANVLARRFFVTAGSLEVEVDPTGQPRPYRSPSPGRSPPRRSRSRSPRRADRQKFLVSDGLPVQEVMDAFADGLHGFKVPRCAWPKSGMWWPKMKNGTDYGPMQEWGDMKLVHPVSGQRCD